MFSYEPPLSKTVWIDGFPVLDVSECSDITSQVKKIIDSTTRTHTTQKIKGIPPESMKDIMGVECTGGKLDVYGDRFPNDSGFLTITNKGVGSKVQFNFMRHHQDNHSVEMTQKFIEQRNAIKRNNPHVVSSNGSIHYIEQPSRPIGSIFTFSRSKKYNSKNETLVENAIKGIWSIHQPDKSKKNGVLAIQVGHFTYSNSKWGYAAGDSKASHRISPDILIVPTTVGGKKVCVEVDGAPHRGNEKDDIERTRCLNEAGWEVIRVRMDDQNPIGVHDVVVSGHTVTPDDLVRIILKVQEVMNAVPEVTSTQPVVKPLSFGHELREPVFDSDEPDFNNGESVDTESTPEDLGECGKTEPKHKPMSQPRDARGRFLPKK